MGPRNNEISGERQASTTVWIVEDDADYRKTLEFVLRNTLNFELGPTFGRCESLLRLLDQNTKTPTSESAPAPDVLVMDVNLPGMSGLEGIREVKERAPAARIVVLTVRDDPESIYSALAAGASGYLAKNAAIDDIIAAIRQAHRGGMLMPSGVAKEVLAFFKSTPSPSYGLTARETEVLRLMTQALAQKEIAEKLCASPHTINTHIKNIYSKLHVHSGIAAVVKALREGLL